MFLQFRTRRVSRRAFLRHIFFIFQELEGTVRSKPENDDGKLLSRIIVACTAFQNDGFSAERFYESIKETLMDMKPILTQAHRL